MQIETFVEAIFVAWRQVGRCSVQSAHACNEFNAYPQVQILVYNEIPVGFFQFNHVFSCHARDHFLVCMNKFGIGKNTVAQFGYVSTLFAVGETDSEWGRHVLLCTVCERASYEIMRLAIFEVAAECTRVFFSVHMSVGQIRHCAKCMHQCMQ